MSDAKNEISKLMLLPLDIEPALRNAEALGEGTCGLAILGDAALLMITLLASV